MLQEITRKVGIPDTYHMAVEREPLDNLARRRSVDISTRQILLKNLPKNPLTARIM